MRNRMICAKRCTTFSGARGLRDALAKGRRASLA
jgi:hypothetical protein